MIMIMTILNSVQQLADISILTKFIDVRNKQCHIDRMIDEGQNNNKKLHDLNLSSLYTNYNPQAHRTHVISPTRKGSHVTPAFHVTKILRIPYTPIRTTKRASERISGGFYRRGKRLSQRVLLEHHFGRSRQPAHSSLTISYSSSSSSSSSSS